MRTSSDYAFLLAYQWWLNCDFHFLTQLRGKPSFLDERWVTQVGTTYQVVRSIPEGQAAVFADMVQKSGQGSGMPIEERAARIALALEKRNPVLTSIPASAATKISWFVWPDGWTMMDRYAVKAVIGSPQCSGIEKLERFYVALAMRGFADVIAKLRACFSQHAMAPLLAERTLDKLLFLEGADDREQIFDALDDFMSALPFEVSRQLYSVAENVGEVLAEAKLLHRDNRSDRTSLTERLARYHKFKSSIS